MSLQIYTSERSAPVHVWRLFSDLRLWIDPSELTTSVAVVYCGDLFGGMPFSRLFAIPRPLEPVGGLYRLSTYSTDSVESLTLSSKPDTFKFSNGYDLAAYGDFFQNALTVLRNSFPYEKISLPSQENERFTRHSNLTGVLIPKVQPAPLLDSELVFFTGGPYATHNLPGWIPIYNQGKVLSLGPLSLEFSGFPALSGLHTFNLIEMLDYFKLNGSSVEMWGYDAAPYVNRREVWRCETSNLSYSLESDFSLEVTYHTYCYSMERSASWSWDTRVEVHPGSFSNPPVTPVVGSTYQARYGSDLEYTFSVLNFTALSGLDRVGPSQFTRSRTRNWFDFQSSFPVSTFVDDFGKNWSRSYYLSKYLDSTKLNFFSAINDNWSDILPTSSFSTVDALGNLAGSVDNNVLQTVAKIPNISAALPDVQKAVKILGSLVKRDLSGATIRDILDLSTSTTLQASFVWRPYKDLLTKILPVFASILPVMLSDKHLQLGYGTFTYDFHKEFGRENVHLVTRTKVVVDVTLSGFWSAALSLDALGLLPRTSRVWDLIPFTFVVNWITGVNSMLDRLETLSIATCVPISYVHSYSLTSSFTGAELDALSASSAGNLEAGLKVYIRDISRYAPFPRSSRFPYGVPTSSPHWGVVASLLYQLFLS